MSPIVPDHWWQGQLTLCLKLVTFKKLNIKSTLILHTSFAVALALTSVSVASAQAIEASRDPHIESHIRAFLKRLNGGTGKPIEQLPPARGRAVLAGAQKSVQVDLSGIPVTEKTINTGGQAVKLHIVKSMGTTRILPVFMFFHGEGSESSVDNHLLCLYETSRCAETYQERVSCATTPLYFIG